MPIYDKPVHQLMHDMATDLGLQPGQVFDKATALDWFARRYPKIKEGTVSAHLVRMSSNDRGRLNHTVNVGADDLFYKVAANRYRLYDPETDAAPIHKGTAGLASGPAANLTVSEDIEDNLAPAGGQEFAYESDLRDYLAKNLHLIEAGLRLYTEDGVTGIEFPVGGRFIDILAVDGAGGYVVVELKVSRGHERVVGQLLRYVGWIRKNQAEPGQNVRGVIVARTIDHDLALACSEIPSVKLFQYELSVTLRAFEG